LFFQLDDQTITCRPMKGTVKRGRTTFEDLEQSNWLKNSSKNRAENVMIVDMIRNDLGRIAKIGSVQVAELFQTERYPTLWQMTSTVSAQTHASVTDIFRGLFPCASITGAPKISTMKIIHDLEKTPRKIYTGSIGYLFPERKAKFNVAIRTALIDTGTRKAEYGLGGGIVWDSTSDDEYAEALLKARLLTEPPPPEFSLLETLLWTPEEGYFLLEKHIERLLDSAQYFDFAISGDEVDNHLSKLAKGFVNAQRVRLLIDRQGNVRSEHISHQQIDQALKATLANLPVNSNDVFLFHKTTERSIYERARQNHPAMDDVLLYNENGDLTEFTIGNLVVEQNGELLTPPITCGVLAGTFRAYLVESGTVRERTVPVQQLKDCTRIFRVNSVRKWERVEMSISG
jgi:para-aminobenzoate synthetase/4-amino-4-deoxychorismate lyase